MIELYDDDDTVIDLSRWTHKIVCPRCKGHGTHVNPAVDGHGLTRDDIDELGDEFLDDYLSGVYDVVCLDCDGRNVVDEIDEAAMERDEPATYRRYIAALRDHWETESIYEMERRMGA